MQTANILLSLGGDHGNTIPKFSVTAAEIAVLRAIHGEDAVNDIEPTGNVERKNREERARLVFTYGAAKTHDQKPIVEGLFPGVAARVFEKIDELDLDPSFFKATGRLKADSVVEATQPSWDAGLRTDGPTIAEWVARGYPVNAYPPRGYEAKSTPEEIAAFVSAAVTTAVPQEESTEDDDNGIDGVDDMDDEHAEKPDNVLG